MRWLLLISSFEVLRLAGACLGADSSFALKDGIIRYHDEDGAAKLVRLRRCADLWVAPDRSAIAFITVDKVWHQDAKAEYKEGDPVEKSSVYVARKSDGFAPVLVASKPIVILGRSWSIFRDPNLSPDGSTLYFSIPDSMVSSTLVSRKLPDGRYDVFGWATRYCVVWNGEYSGQVLMQRRHMPPIHSTKGIGYQCYLRSQLGSTGLINTDCDDIERFSKVWATEHGGTCSLIPSHYY